jgi:hypothetical protein
LLMASSPLSALPANAAAEGAAFSAQAVPKSSPVSPKGQSKAGTLAKAAKTHTSQVSQQITFIENKGQFDKRVKFQVANAGRTLWLTQGGIVFDFQRCGASGASSSAPGPVMPVPRQIAELESKKLTDCGMERNVINQGFLGSSEQAKIEAKEIQPGVRNYLTGSDPAKWQTGIREFSEVIYHDIWPGIDLRLYGKGSDLEQEFIVNPGVDAGQVQLAYKGIDNLKVGDDGSLLIRAAAGRMRETTPRIYQEISGRRVPVKGRFKLLSSTSYTFEIAAYDKRQPLVIDPTLLYSTFLGGSAGNNIFTIGTRETATGIAVDQAGNAYVTGFTQSPDFPTTPGAFQTSFGGGQQTFIAKLNPSGSALIYATYLNDPFPAGISVDAVGNAYVAGWNAGSGFPTTSNAYSQTCNGSGFLTILNASGSGLLYSTCFSGAGSPTSGISGPVVTAITADASGRAYITGNTSNQGFPTTVNAYQPSYPGSIQSGFVTVFDTTLSGTASLAYSTYLGIVGPISSTGDGVSATAIAVDTFGKIYVTGWSADGFPVTPGAFQTTHAPCLPNGPACPLLDDVFVSKIDPVSSGSQSLIYSTYLGGQGTDRASGIAVDGAGSAYITGTTSLSTFPVTPGAFQTDASSCGSPLFVTKLNAAGSVLIYSTYLCGNRFANDNTANGIAVDSLGNAYVVGAFRAEASASFPLTPDAFQNSFTKLSGDFHDSFLTKLNPAGSSLVYSSYLGGEGDDVATAVAVDQTGDAYVAGHTSSFNFPTTPAAFQPGMHGSGDAFVTKFPLSEAFRVLGLSIHQGGNTGKVTPTVFGSGFHAGCSVSLVGASQVIQASQVTNGAFGRFLFPSFDLSGAPPGVYSVSVTSPEGTSQTLANSFTIEPGGTSDIWMDVSGRSLIRGGLEQVTTITVGNRGTINAAPARVWLTFPSFLSYRTVSGVQPTVLGQIDQTTYLAFDIPAVPAGSTVSIILGLTLPDDPTLAHQTFQVQLWKDGQ